MPSAAKPQRSFSAYWAAVAKRGALVRSVSNGAGALEALARERPDVVLLDVHLPSGTGADVIRGVGDRAPGTRWLAL